MTLSRLDALLSAEALSSPFNELWTAAGSSWRSDLLSINEYWYQR
jgi:hypothetical protein